MRMIKVFGIIILLPENKTDRFLSACLDRQTKGGKISFMANYKKMKGSKITEYKGGLHCEFVKNCDHEFEPWPKDHFMTRIQEARVQN